MTLKTLVNLGAANQAYSIANKARATNITVLFAILISALYTLNYILEQPLVAGINFFFVIAYGVTLLLTKYEAHKASKLWFFSFFMLHLAVCTNVYVTNKTGLHWYFVLVPIGAFLLFELSDVLAKTSLSIIAILLFFYCENTVNISPLIALSDEVNHLIYQSVFVFSMLEVMLVLTFFANDIEVSQLKLTKQATIDSLTGTFNRHYFFEQAGNNLARASKHQRPFSIILLDFDHFKHINDKYGHHIGDLSLIDIANQIKKYCRTQDCFARVGGDEFVIALSDTTLQEAKFIAEHIQKTIAKHVIEIPENPAFQCEISVGLSSVSSINEPLKTLMQHAEQALYRAKEQGGNRVVLANYS